MHILGSFEDEDELDLWYSSEKERLDEEFFQKMESDRDNTPKHKEAYRLELKKLVEKYQRISTEFLEKQKKALKNKNLRND